MGRGIMGIKIDHNKILMVLSNTVFTALFFLLYYLCENLKQVTIVGIIQYMWMLTTWFIATKNIMNVYLFFLALSFCFYMGQPILYLFNLDIDRMMSIENSPFSLAQIKNTLVFILESMALFHLGASFTVEKIAKVNKVKVNKKAMIFVGSLLCIVSIGPQLSFTINSLITTLTVGYSNIFSSDFIQGSGFNGGIPRLFAGFFEGSLLLLILGNNDNKKWRTYWLWFAVVYSIVNIISGQRGSNVLFLISIIVLYHYTIKPFTRRQMLNFVWIILIAAIGLSFISEIRNISILDYNSEQIVNLFFNNNLIVGLLAEMGFTLIACTTVMVYAPSVIPFNDGATYYNSLTSLIPNLFWDVHPAAGGGVDQVFNSFLMNNSGMGSSFIIETYYNFGYYGLLIIPFFGFLVGKMYFGILRASHENNYLKLFVWISLIPIFLWFIRSETITFWRNFGYYIIFPLVLIILYSAFVKKKRFSHKQQKYSFNVTNDL